MLVLHREVSSVFSTHKARAVTRFPSSILVIVLFVELLHYYIYRGESHEAFLSVGVYENTYMSERCRKHVVRKSATVFCLT